MIFTCGPEGGIDLHEIENAKGRAGQGEQFAAVQGRQEFEKKGMTGLEC